MNVDLVKHKALDSLQIMSQRLRELKTGKLVTQKKLENVQKKLNSNEYWMKSPYAPSISYYKTRILYMGNTINNLLECTDDIGYLISILNGRSDMYIRGNGSVLNFGNHRYLKGFEMFKEILCPKSPSRVRKNGMSYETRPLLRVAPCLQQWVSMGWNDNSNISTNKSWRKKYRWIL